MEGSRLRLLSKDNKYLKEALVSLDEDYTLKVVYNAKGVTGYHLYLGGKDNSIPGRIMKKIYEFSFKYDYWILDIKFDKELGPFIHLIDFKPEPQDQIEEDKQFKETARDYIG